MIPYRLLASCHPQTTYRDGPHSACQNSLTVDQVGQSYCGQQSRRWSPGGKYVRGDVTWPSDVIKPVPREQGVTG